ncbi:protein LYRIC isoform X2 [Rhinatrema bivittatum]|uniref:protein LYRIC isoform X2 n=1 Tax=Rhinatrema bivittatum TaxID=194408 RepID=UPI00112A8888|nr:protein LYRIC isoform X2 [Rhinatrema bivittatum]
MAAGWQDALALQAEAVAARLREALTSGLVLLRSELGLDLGLEPQRLPAWLLLLMPLLVLVVLALLWSAACSCRKRSRAEPGEEEEEEEEESVVAGKAAAPKSLKADELKKKPKKKITERGKPNGRPILDLSEEEILPVTRKETLKQPLDAEKKNEKSKKSKKKIKPETKQTQISSLDGKEVDEGAWETKISNREKRQQRKRDKVTGDGDLETTSVVAAEQLSTVTSLPLGPRKSKGDTLQVVRISTTKLGKGDSPLQGLSEIPAVNGGSWTEKPMKLPAQVGGSEEKWASLPSAPKRKSENSAWSQDTGDSGGNGKDWGGVPLTSTWSERPLFSSIPPWSTVDGRINASEQTSASFTSLGLNSAVSGTTSETVSQPSTSDIQWDISCNQPHIDDEWSGPNGLDSGDPGSDWNAPAEAWGNWVEEETACPPPEEPVSDYQKVSDNEREKEATLQSATSSKSKKKKKKKKKQGEETSSPAQDPEDVDREVGDDFQEDNTNIQPQQEIVFPVKTISTSEPAEPEEEEPPLAVLTEPSVTVLLSIPEKISSQVPQMLQETDVSNSNKQNSVPPPSQTKSEESWESPKQVKKKKKARRET